MTVDRDPDYLISLVLELKKLPKETEWNDLYDHICENSGFPLKRLRE